MHSDSHSDIHYTVARLRDTVTRTYMYTALIARTIIAAPTRIYASPQDVSGHAKTLISDLYYSLKQATHTTGAHAADGAHARRMDSP